MNIHAPISAGVLMGISYVADCKKYSGYWLNQLIQVQDFGNIFQRCYILKNFIENENQDPIN